MCTELCMPELFFVCGGAVIRLTCSGSAVSPAPFANLKIINFMLCTLHYCIKVPGRDSLAGEGLYSTQGRDHCIRMRRTCGDAQIMKRNTEKDSQWPRDRPAR